MDYSVFQVYTTYLFVQCHLGIKLAVCLKPSDSQLWAVKSSTQPLMRAAPSRLRSFQQLLLGIPISHSFWHHPRLSNSFRFMTPSSWSAARFIQIQYMSKVNKDGDNRRNTAAFSHLDMILSKVFLQIQWVLLLITLSCDGFSFLYNRETYR